MKTITKLVATAIIVIAIISIFFLGDSATGKIKVTAPADNTHVILSDGSQKTLSSGETSTFHVDTGTTTVTISADNLIPWAKEIFVEKGATVNLHPFMLTTNPSGEIVTEADPEYSKIISLVKNSSIPVREKKLASKDGNVEVWVSGSSIFAAWVGDSKDTPEFFCHSTPCDPNIQVFKGELSIESLDFYKNRNDVVVFASGNGIYAIELDSRGIQNFQPVLLGNHPKFYKNSDKSLFVTDQNTLVELAI